MLKTETTEEEKTPSSPSMEPQCHCFTLSELRLATDNFDEELCIGRGGFGKVYRGSISNFGPDNSNTYAIKRLHIMSDQGAPEFWVEVEMLSRLRHCNLVSLVGYCNEEKEMALVYEYMHNGTLSDHLHKNKTLLSWSQRLKICTGAARGLDYLHTGTGTQHGIIHRDVKSSNILLDQNYAAKIGDFGLAKIGPINQTHVSTQVKGTFGYMDPSYFYTGRLTKKSDVYAFGVVLVEVLSGRPTSDESLDEGLAIWAQDHIKKGKVNQIIDSSLREPAISKNCLKELSRIAVRCLLRNPNHRPPMSEVVSSLDLALSFQERKGSGSSSHGRKMIKKVWSILSLKGYIESKETISKPDVIDLLPEIEDLQIIGDAIPGGQLQVCGYSVSGTVACMIQWSRHLSDGTFEYIQDGTDPSYMVGLEDVGASLSVGVIPLDENNRQGRLVKCVANGGHVITAIPGNMP